jgi:hypothetical protein
MLREKESGQGPISEIGQEVKTEVNLSRKFFLFIFSSSLPGVGGSDSVRVAAVCTRFSGSAWPHVPLLWAPCAGPQLGCGRALCPQGSGPVLFCSLGPGLAVREF